MEGDIGELQQVRYKPMLTFILYIPRLYTYFYIERWPALEETEFYCAFCYRKLLYTDKVFAFAKHLIPLHSTPFYSIRVNSRADCNL